ncbi:MAG TPA: NYN domain-containing protein [Candidatus Acidoferrales bacterium]|nr:NYN domain-containing protein [Candidatus Acidoferrales bacterium]
MSKVVVFIDGFNLYHAIKAHPKYRPYKWLNLKKLASLYVHGSDTLEAVLYFTTLATWDTDKAQRHKVYIRALENEGVTIVYGEFKRKQKHCSRCQRDFWSFEEKQTDVNIALSLFQLAVADRYDKAVIISGDTDLLPAVKAVRSTFPSKHLGVVIPIGRASEDLKKQADFHYKMREHHLASSRFSDVIALKDKSLLKCPDTWK